MANCKLLQISISLSVQLSDNNSLYLVRGDHKLFQRLISQLIFLITTTQPDILFTMNQLSQFLAGPRQVHLAMAKHILHYIQVTLDFGLVFGIKRR